MEDGRELDLTYVTERIIAVSFPAGCSEESYLHSLQEVTHMLRWGHSPGRGCCFLRGLGLRLGPLWPRRVCGDSGPRREAKVARMVPQKMGTWWAPGPAQPRTCLSPASVVSVRGGDTPSLLPSADQALDRFAMKKYYDDKVSALMQPSQKRYVHHRTHGLLSGTVKMNASPLFLHCVILHGTPNFDTGGVCRPFLKLYQAMQPVYTSGIYNVGPENPSRIYIAIEPAQLLKGDVMVKCYHKKYRSATRDVIFRLQFHTGAVQGCSLVFGKQDLDSACQDDRFPASGKIELVFSASPERIQGCEHFRSNHGVSVDFNTADPLIRWDSYENLGADGEVLHTQGPVDGSLYAKVRKKSALDPGVPAASSPDHSDHTLGKARLPGISAVNGTGPEPSPDPSPGSPTLDIDQSIDQLNRLILELDPTFEPLPTHMNKLGSLASSPSAPDDADSRAASRPCRFQMVTPAHPANLGECVVDGRVFSPSKTGSGSASPTPAFPVSPLTPYAFLPPFLPGGPGQPPLPEKKRASEGDHSLGSVSPASSGFSSPHSGSTMSIPFPSVLPDFSKPPEAAAPSPENPGEKQVTVSFVQDTSKFWYKADISREQAIAMLRDKEPGSFVVRDSHSFRGAYGLAMKVATPPPSVLQLNKKAGDLANELVRHFLVECTPKGVRLKGCSNEPYFAWQVSARSPWPWPDRRWTPDPASLRRVFGFVARKQGSATDNVCHLFAEHDPEQPASAIVNFVSKVMIGSPRKI
ncbi:PREDICTED: tensin-3 [Myotis brandtii]|uniref:tensin-3 n=1 Tax=Myotis brandtii TaxID=109478 RepID=UPI0007047CD3|nr:PREDICTED: tensin-3 [Myotis brandtii]